jgi:uncharacterized oxidoreductase
MNTQNNTILIIGGSAGIGLAIAEKLTERGNKIIITGRNQERLDAALKLLPGASAFRADVIDERDTIDLLNHIKAEFPKLNMVINNAGQAYKYDIASSEKAFDMALDEITTNYLAIIRLNELVLPLLRDNDQPVIVNVSSVVAFVPGQLTTYSASKAALHSYTQSLRIALERTSKVKVFELMPPLVNTAFSAPINGQNGIPAAQVADELLTALEHDIYEIRVGNTQAIYDLYLKSPEQALIVMNPSDQ